MALERHARRGTSTGVAVTATLTRWHGKEQHGEGSGGRGPRTATLSTATADSHTTPSTQAGLNGLPHHEPSRRASNVQTAETG